MKILLLLLLVVSYNVAYSYETIDYDTVEVKSNQGQLHKRWVEARWTGNESPFKKYGTLKYWHTSAELSEIGFYYWDKKESVFGTFYENGDRKSVTNYLHDKKHGRYTEWFYKDYIKTDIYYKNDRLNGLCVWRNYPEDLNNIENGIIKKAFYVDGQELVIFIGSNIYINKSPYFNKNYNLQIEWKNLNPYFNKSPIFFVGKLKNDKKHGKWITYNVDGDILDIDLYNNGEIIVVED